MSLCAGYVCCFFRHTESLALVPKSESKKPNYWTKANKEKDRRSGILPLYIKKSIRTMATMKAAGCRLQDPRHSLRADRGGALWIY